jgi:mRNA interferase MazF
VGRVSLIRGEIRWYTFRLPDKRRPVLVLTRNEVIGRLNEIIVAPVTRTIRGLSTEVLLTEDDGMPAACALNFDHIALGQRDRFGSVLCTLSEKRWPEVQKALLTACGFDRQLD